MPKKSIKFINGWNYLYKDRNRVEVRLRLGFLTVFDLTMDPDDRIWRLVLFNCGWYW